MTPAARALLLDLARRLSDVGGDSASPTGAPLAVYVDDAKMRADTIAALNGAVFGDDVDRCVMCGATTELDGDAPENSWCTDHVACRARRGVIGPSRGAAPPWLHFAPFVLGIETACGKSVMGTRRTSARVLFDAAPDACPACHAWVAEHPLMVAGEGT